MPDPQTPASDEADLVDLYLSRALLFLEKRRIDRHGAKLLRMYVDACLRVRALTLDTGVRLLVTPTTDLDSDWANKDLAPRS